MNRNTGFPYRNILQYTFWRIVAPLRISFMKFPFICYLDMAVDGKVDSQKSRMDERMGKKTNGLARPTF